VQGKRRVCFGRPAPSANAKIDFPLPAGPLARERRRAGETARVLRSGVALTFPGGAWCPKGVAAPRSGAGRRGHAASSNAAEWN